MKCSAIQRYLLGIEDPDRPSAQAREHLNRCAACLAWQQKLLQVENDVLQWPVPASEAKAPFVQQFLKGTIAARPSPAQSWRPWQVRERARRKLALATSLAAALVLFALGWWVIQHGNGGPHTPEHAAGPSFVQSEGQKIKDEAGKARSPRDKLIVYKAYAGKLWDRTESASGDNLAELVAFCSKDFLQEGIVAEAKRLPLEQREETLSSIVDQLNVLSEKAAYRSHRQEDENAADAEQFNRLAVAYKESAQELRKLYT